MDTRNINFFSVVTIVTLLATSLANDVFSQARAGIKGGLNVSNLFIDDLDDENARYGFNIGVFGQVLSSKHSLSNPSYCIPPKA